jgi:hypothetical protein
MQSNYLEHLAQLEGWTFLARLRREKCGKVIRAAHIKVE